MYIKREKEVSVPSGFRCHGCGQLKHYDSKGYGKSYFYCDITGEILKGDNKGVVKTVDCFKAIRQSLIKE